LTSPLFGDIMPRSSRGAGLTPWDASPVPSSEAASPEDAGFRKEPTQRALSQLNIFGVQLLVEPSGRKKQPIKAGIDPGSKYTGVAVASKKAILCGFNLELPDWIKERMDKRRERRRNRRYRKCRRRECRFLNRAGNKIAPSILARKQMELRVMRELAKTYPITEIAMEDVAYKHGKGNMYEGGFSQVEVGKNWLISKLEKIAPVKLFKGWEVSKRRGELGLKKMPRKGARTPESHVSDAVALCSLVLGNIVLHSTLTL